LIPRGYVREKTPVQLCICQESQQFALAKYQSLFLLPSPFSYTGRLKWKVLRKFCGDIGYKKRLEGTVAEVAKKVEKWANIDLPKEEGMEVMQLDGPKQSSWCFMQRPRWYSPDIDILLLEAPAGRQYPYSSGGMSRLFGMLVISSALRYANWPSALPNSTIFASVNATS
jgi:hypothetical protein